MAMLPMFLSGLVMGITVAYLYYLCRKDTPSKTKLKIQEREIARQKSDNEMLHDLIKKLYAKIDKLEEELKNKN